MSAEKSFIVLSGPSGIGKGALRKAVERIEPALVQARPILYTSRKPRANETPGKDYHFRSADDIQKLGKDKRYAVAQVRSDWQAVDLEEVEHLLKTNATVFAEVYYTFGDVLLHQARSFGVPLRSVFLMPMEPTTAPEDVVAEMCFRLARRGTDAWNKIKERAASSVREMEASRAYTHRMVNRVGEDDVAQWGDCGTSLGMAGNRHVEKREDLGEEAKWLLNTFIAICKGSVPDMRDGDFLAFETRD